MKAEVARLTEENSQLRDEVLEQRGAVMGLQEQLAELAESGDAAAVAQVWLLGGDVSWRFLLYLA